MTAHDAWVVALLAGLLCALYCMYCIGVWHWPCLRVQTCHSLTCHSMQMVLSIACHCMYKPLPADTTLWPGCPAAERWPS